MRRVYDTQSSNSIFETYLPNLKPHEIDLAVLNNKKFDPAKTSEICSILHCLTSGKLRYNAGGAMEIE